MHTCSFELYDAYGQGCDSTLTPATMCYPSIITYQDLLSKQLFLGYLFSWVCWVITIRPTGTFKPRGSQAATDNILSSDMTLTTSPQCIFGHGVHSYPFHIIPCLSLAPDQRYRAQGKFPVMSESYHLSFTVSDFHLSLPAVAGIRCRESCKEIAGMLIYNI